MPTSTPTAAWFSRNPIVDLYADAREPTISDTRHRDGSKLSNKPQRLAHLDPADDRNTDALAVERDSLRAIIGPEAVMNTFLLEPRMLGFVGEEPVKCSAKIFEGLRRRNLRYLQHPWELFTFDRLQLPAQSRFVRPRASLGLLLSLGKRPIPGEPRGSGRFGERDALGLVRIERDLVRQDHSSAAAASALAARFFAARRPYRRAQKDLRIAIMS